MYPVVFRVHLLSIAKLILCNEICSEKKPPKAFEFFTQMEMETAKWSWSEKYAMRFKITWPALMVPLAPLKSNRLFIAPQFNSNRKRGVVHHFDQLQHHLQSDHVIPEQMWL